MSSKDTATSILIVVAFVISMQTLSYQETKKTLTKVKKSVTVKRGPATVEKFSKCNQAFDVKRTDPYNITQGTVGPATSCDHHTLRAHKNCYDEKQEEPKKGGCSTCSNDVQLQRPKRMIEGFSNCANVNNPFTYASNVKSTGINDLTNSDVKLIQPNTGEVHGNSEDKNTSCSVGFAEFKKVSGCSAEPKTATTKAATTKAAATNAAATKTAATKAAATNAAATKAAATKAATTNAAATKAATTNAAATKAATTKADATKTAATKTAATKTAATKTAAKTESKSSPSSAPATVEGFSDNTCTTIDGGYAMVASEGLQLSSVTSNSEFEFAKLGLTNLGKEVTGERKGHPKFGATARKEHLIRGVSEGGNLYSWNLKARGVSNFGCSSVPQALTNEGRFEETTDLVKAKVHPDGQEYGKNTFNNPSSMEWDAKADNRN